MSALLDAILTLSASTLPEVVALSPESVCILLFAQQVLSKSYTWLDKSYYQADVVTDADMKVINSLLAQLTREILNPIVGLIFPYVLAVQPPGTLTCDGATYARVDYPILYASIDSAFVVDADHFVVPDLRERVIFGTGATHAVGSVGGAETVTLDVSQMPAHTHTSAPHAHSEVSAIATLINGGLEAPASAALPAAAFTGSASVAIDSAGGGGAHENMPPFLTLKFCIVAA